MARFEREARVLASLNHPNIAHLYGLETAKCDDSDQGGDPREMADNSKLNTKNSKIPSGTVTFLVMEFVDGADLANRVGRGPIPVDEALPIALQIADALDTAHEKGIVHRDLKPANVMVDPEGRVKVLDWFSELERLFRKGPSESPQRPEAVALRISSPTFRSRNAPPHGVLSSIM